MDCEDTLINSTNKTVPQQVQKTPLTVERTEKKLSEKSESKQDEPDDYYEDAFDSVIVTAENKDSLKLGPV